MGSIDVTASARSVLQLEQDPDDPEVRVIRQVKSSLARRGENVRFRIFPGYGIEWLGREEADYESLENASEQVQMQIPESSGPGRKETKQTLSAVFLREILSEGPLLSSEIEAKATEAGLGLKTLALVKTNLGIKSLRKGGKWYWAPPENWRDGK